MESCDTVVIQRAWADEIKSWQSFKFPIIIQKASKRYETEAFYIWVINYSNYDNFEETLNIIIYTEHFQGVILVF